MKIVVMCSLAAALLFAALRFTAAPQAAVVNRLSESELGGDGDGIDVALVPIQESASRSAAEFAVAAPVGAPSGSPVPKVKQVEAPDRWQRFAPVPRGEPLIDVLETSTKADLRASFLSLRMNKDEMAQSLLSMEVTYHSVAFRLLQEKVRHGTPDLVSSVGYQGLLQESDLPEHYHGSFWYHTAGKGDQEGFFLLTRLSPNEHMDLYEQKWTREVLQELLNEEAWVN